MGDLGTTEFATVLLVFRVLFGVVFASHGIAKAKSLDGTAGWFDSIGMKPGAFHARAAAGTEIGTGLLLALGLLTPLAAAGIVAVMIVAGWTVHAKNGFGMVNDGWEYTFVVAITALLLAGLGPGEYSLDALIGMDETLNGWSGIAISAGVGVAAGIGQIVIFFRPAD